MKKKLRVPLFIILVLLMIIFIKEQSLIDAEEISTNKSCITNYEIRQKWLEYRPIFKGNPYKYEPSPSYPYKTGKLESEFIEDGIRMTNFIRYLAGLPDDLELDPLLNEQAQYGAVLLAATKTLCHDPPKPEDMKTDFYDIGHNVTKKSNIASGIYTLSGAVVAYTLDFGDSNLENIGHRRWILNPQTTKIGFGYCEGYSTMMFHNEGRKKEIPYDYITYPTEGNFPSSLFYASAFPYGSNPWSIILNPKKYDNEKLSDIRIELKDLNDHTQIWRFCPYEDTCSREKYFKVDTSSCGVPFCIIFRPDDVYDYEKGCRYKVRVTGIYTLEGEMVEIKYEVNFI